MGYLLWNGASSQNYGLVLEKTPLPVRFERVTENILIPNGMPIAYETSQYKPQTITLNLGVKDKSKINDIYAWLRGRGTLTFSNDNTVYYDAVCNGAITPQSLCTQFGKMTVQFVLFPFRKSIINNWIELELTDGETHFQYNGSEPGLPTVKVTGSGRIYFQIGGTYFYVDNVDTNVTVDVTKRRVFDKDGNVIISSVVNTGGDWMNSRWAVGTNNAYIKVTGNYTKVEIKKNEWWL